MSRTEFEVVRGCEGMRGCEGKKMMRVGSDPVEYTMKRPMMM
jgi:hypothetical protein